MRLAANSIIAKLAKVYKVLAQWCGSHKAARLSLDCARDAPARISAPKSPLTSLRTGSRLRNERLLGTTARCLRRDWSVEH